MTSVSIRVMIVTTVIFVLIVILASTDFAQPISFRGLSRSGMMNPLKGQDDRRKEHPQESALIPEDRSSH